MYDVTRIISTTHQPKSSANLTFFEREGGRGGRTQRKYKITCHSRSDGIRNGGFDFEEPRGGGGFGVVDSSTGGKVRGGLVLRRLIRAFAVSRQQ